DLVGRLARVGGDAADGDDLKSLSRPNAQSTQGVAPDHGVDPRLVVFQREIAVPRAMHAAEAGDLPAQAHIAVGTLQRPLDGVGELRNRELGKVAALPGAG